MHTHYNTTCYDGGWEGAEFFIFFSIVEERVLWLRSIWIWHGMMWYS